MSFLITPLYLLRQGTSLNPVLVGFIGLAGWLTWGPSSFPLEHWIYMQAAYPPGFYVVLGIRTLAFMSMQ